ELGGVADGDTAAVAVGIRLATDLVQVHPAGVEIEVEVEVDVDVKTPRDGENACDLLVRVRVGVGTAADQVGALFACCHQQLLGAGIVDETLLREGANLQIERPGVLALERGDGAKPLEADARVDLDVGAHVHGAVENGPLQRLAGAGD